MQKSTKMEGSRFSNDDIAQALCHYRGQSRDVSGLRLPIDAVRTSGVVTEGLSGLQPSGGKGFTKDSCSVAFVIRC